MNTTPQYSFGTLVRKPNFRQFLANDLPLTILCLAGLIVAGMDGIFLGNVLFWFSLAIAMCLVYRCFYLKSMSYTFTAEQIIYEHGVFKRTRDYCELYRVIDFREESSFLQQIFGLKTVTIYSGDRSTPRLDIVGIGSIDNIIPVIRERVTANRKRHGIYEITNR